MPPLRQAWIAWRSGSLLPSMLAHLLNNAILLTLATARLDETLSALGENAAAADMARAFLARPQAPAPYRARAQARLALIDTLGCGFEALSYPECTSLLGPVVPGTIVPNGARVPGTPHVLDPERAAFNIGVLGRWLDFNDAFYGETVIQVFRDMRKTLAPQQGQERETWIQALLIGDVVIVGVPAEFFTKLGLDIKNRSPFRYTYFAELANDWIGYLPDREGHRLGGYQTWTGFHSYAEPGTGERVADEAVKLLKELASGP